MTGHMRIRSVVLLGIAMASLQACAGALAGGTTTPAPTVAAAAPVAPTVPTPAPIVAQPYDGHVPRVSSWQDHSPETAAFTNAITINVDCDDPDAVTNAQAILAGDARPVIWFAPMFTYGGDGYELRPNASACWQRERDLIAANRARSIDVHLLDEPADVAWSFWVDGGTVYDPNRYNDIITTAVAMVRADFPDLDVSYNFGSLPAGAVVASGPTLIALEAYDATWQSKLQQLEALTPLPLWLMSPGFIDGDPVANDPILAQRVRDQWTWMQHDARIVGDYWFLECCDDTKTGDQMFYTVGGGHLPMTLQALTELGAAIRGGR